MYILSYLLSDGECCVSGKDRKDHGTYRLKLWSVTLCSKRLDPTAERCLRMSKISKGEWCRFPSKAGVMEHNTIVVLYPRFFSYSNILSLSLTPAPMLTFLNEDVRPHFVFKPRGIRLSRAKRYKSPLGTVCRLLYAVLQTSETTTLYTFLF